MVNIAFDVVVSGTMKLSGSYACGGLHDASWEAGRIGIWYESCAVERVAD